MTEFLQLPVRLKTYYGIAVSQYLLFISCPVIGYLSPHLRYCQERSSLLAGWERAWLLCCIPVLLRAVVQHLKSGSFGRSVAAWVWAVPPCVG